MYIIFLKKTILISKNNTSSGNDPFYGYEQLNRVCLSVVYFVSGDVTDRACGWLRDYLLHSKMIIFY